MPIGRRHPPLSIAATHALCHKPRPPLPHPSLPSGALLCHRATEGCNQPQHSLPSSSTPLPKSATKRCDLHRSQPSSPDSYQAAASPLPSPHQHGVHRQEAVAASARPLWKQTCVEGAVTVAASQRSVTTKICLLHLLLLLLLQPRPFISGGDSEDSLHPLRKKHSKTAPFLCFGKTGPAILLRAITHRSLRNRNCSIRPPRP
ncbi:hypothetical protein B296_00040037 [Ensete ventricosum]|uniref:Uncharacterized protein n=1 Tax=Ensete ventricosum TaxID=4639 RepID=A0A426ZRT4_ENSVE|nr:hypothetical protein B296_00040037 [Ensete ventricosum]